MVLLKQRRKRFQKKIEQLRCKEVGSYSQWRWRVFMLRRYFAVVAAVVMIGLLTACSGPSGPGANQAAQTTPTGPVSTTLSTGPVTLDMYIETGFPLPQKLADEFKRQHPNVTFNIRQDQFQVITENGPREMAGPNPPDLIRLPQVVGPAKQGLLLNLDPYYKAYG